MMDALLSISFNNKYRINVNNVSIEKKILMTMMIVMMRIHMVMIMMRGYPDDDPLGYDLM